MTRRLRSRPTVAALLLAALLPLGCGARDAPGTASLLAARDAPSADATITTPRGAPPTASALIPAAVQGRWTPVSKALAGAGPLTLTAQTLAWSPCGPVARAGIGNDPSWGAYQLGARRIDSACMRRCNGAIARAAKEHTP